MRKIIAIFIVSFFLFPKPVFAQATDDRLTRIPKLSFTFSSCNPTPMATFKWTELDAATAYRFYTQQGGSFTFQETTGNSLSVDLSTTTDTTYKVQGIIKEGGVLEKEGIFSNDVPFTGANVVNDCKVGGGTTLGPTTVNLGNPGGEIKETKQASQTQGSDQVVVQQSSESGNAELEQKVQNLQGELEKAKQRQNVLEQMVTNLVNLIKNIFRLPFGS